MNSHPVKNEHFIRLPELSAWLLSGNAIKTKFITCLTHLLSGQALEYSARLLSGQTHKTRFYEPVLIKQEAASPPASLIHRIL
jgi:hypothetical protein